MVTLSDVGQFSISTVDVCHAVIKHYLTVTFNYTFTLNENYTFYVYDRFTAIVTKAENRRN